MCVKVAKSKEFAVAISEAQLRVGYNCEQERDKRVFVIGINLLRVNGMIKIYNDGEVCNVIILILLMKAKKQSYYSTYLGYSNMISTYASPPASTNNIMHSKIRMPTTISSALLPRKDSRI